MRKAWLAAGVITAAMATSGCVIVVGDDDGSKMFHSTRDADGFTVLDRNGDYSRIGGDMDLRGHVGGDVSLISGDVDMDDMDIGGELSIAAGDVDFTGRVQGEASIAGGDVYWSGYAGRDLSIAAGSLLVEGVVERDGSFAAADMRINAEIRGELRAQADDMFVGADVSGPTRLVAADDIRRSRRNDPEHGRIELAGHLSQGGEVCTRTLIIGPDARIDGTLHVWAESDPVIASGARVNDLRFEARDGRDCDDILD